MADGDAGDPILYKIFERLGGIDTELKVSKEQRGEMIINMHGVRAELATYNERLGKVELLAARIPVIEPTVWELEGRRREAIGVKRFFGLVISKGHAGVALIGGSIGAVLASAAAWLSSLVPHGAPPPHP